MASAAPDYGDLAKGQECLEHMVAQNRKRLDMGPRQRPPSAKALSAVTDLGTQLQQLRAAVSAERTQTDAGIADFEERLQTQEDDQSQAAEMTRLAERLEAFDARLTEIERQRAETVSEEGKNEEDALPQPPAAAAAEDAGSSGSTVEQLELRLHDAFTTVWASFAELETETKKIPPLQDLILRLRNDLDRFGGQ